MAKILIVDDDSPGLYALQVLLEGHGNQVEAATNGQEALDKARAEPPDIMISDILMPVMDGFSLCREWQRDDRLRKIPFVFYTATYTDPKDEELALSLGAARFIIKPLEPDIFMKQVLEVISEAQTGRPTPTEGPLPEEPGYLRLYSERLVKKLEDKMLELQASEQKYRVLIDSASEGILVVQNGMIVLANPRFIEITGYSKEEILATPFMEFIHPDDRATVLDYRQRRLRAEEAPETYSFRIFDRDGKTRWVEISSVLITWEGRPATLNFLTDITERKQAEEDLQESETRYRAVVEQSPDGIYLIDVETKRIVEANMAFQRLLGYTPDELRGLSLYDFIITDRSDIDRRFRDILQGEGGHFFDRRYRKKDGSLVEVWVGGTVISYEGKSAVCVLVRDLTEKKALEVQFLRAQRMESIGLLAGGIAHDLNNILAPILINAELLGPTLSDPTSQRMVSSIVSNAQRGADIVKQILTFARGMEEEFLVVSPKHLLKETERFLRETFPKSIQIQTEIPQDLWPLSGDATQLHQVLMNLCLNARDAMPKGGTLSLSARNVTFDPSYAAMHPDAKIGPYLLFSVEDTGAGIAPEHLQRIFDPFFTTKERDQGTGLGLATASAIVKGHGGFLQVSSELGKGTKFLVFLPASPSAETAKAEEEKASLPTGKGELILLVEDEASVREIIQVALEAYGYQVITACDGAEAVSLYAQHPGEIQVVITDMAMPIMDGATTIRALAKIDPSVKVIAISGAEWEQKAAEASGLAVQVFLQKPFTAKRLLRAVAEVLKG